MNLQVNLIDPGERRSASQIRWTFVLAIAGVCLLGVALFLLSSLLVGASKSSALVDDLARQLKDVDRNYAKVKALQKEQQQYQGIANDPDAWKASGLSIPLLMKDTALIVPLTMQLTRLHMSETMSAISNVVMRSRVLTIQGEVVDDPEGLKVLAFQANLTNRTAFAGMVQDVVVRRFVESGDTNELTVRLFELECKLVDKALIKAEKVKKLIPGDGVTDFTSI